ncbi:chaperone protein dnaJ 11, chloroplastic [Musa acuminata AAA Group]|uniref:chaperone protein dnaJ 11, chloroplastic n=1 Tax=Musa acuminata AAA Group TaxID=214697 RepID=UPI0031D85448
MVSPHSLSSSQFLGLRVALPPRPNAGAAVSPRLLTVAAASSLYEVLGVPASASGQEIKAAYRRLALECHPDVGASADQFLRVHAAYSTLSDPDKRADYDRRLVDSAASAAAAALDRRRRSTYSRSTSFSCGGRRTWETDQCW